MDMGDVCVEKVACDKKRYLDLLLLADEQEDMIDAYLERGEMFLLKAGGQVVAECVVTDEGDGVCELKNLAVMPEQQRKGYGRRLIAWLEEHYRPRFQRMKVGTGESPLTLSFYEKCGFRYSSRIKGFFTEHYAHPIFEGGRQLVDMVYLEKPLFTLLPSKN